MKPTFKQNFRNRGLVFGGWNSIGHSSITEVFCRSGVDFIGIDMEHSTISLEQAQTLMITAQAAGVRCLPRLSSQNPEQIKRLLDSGADGMIVPMVNSKAEVDRLVQWFKYPPVGKRNYGVGRAQGYGFDFKQHTEEWNDRSVLVVQIESIQGVEAVDEIISNPHIDGVMVGPYDLSGSLNIPGQIHHPKVAKACAKVIAACKKYGKACGTHLVDPDPKNLRKAIKDGYSFLILSSDVFLLWQWAERMNGLVKGIGKK